MEKKYRILSNIRKEKTINKRDYIFLKNQKITYLMKTKFYNLFERLMKNYINHATHITAQ